MSAQAEPTLYDFLGQLEPKFRALQKLVPDDLTLDDLQELNREDVIKLCSNAKEKLMLTLLVNTVLYNYFQPLTYPYTRCPAQENIEYTGPYQIGLQNNATGKISSESYRPYHKDPDSCYVCNIKELSGLNFENMQHVTVLNLSHCRLHDYDLPYVIELVKDWINQRGISLRYVILDRNLITEKANESVEELIRIGVGVSVIGNRITSSDNKEWLSQMAESATNLIWVPQSWLELKGWQKIITDEQQRKSVREAHERFYKYYPDNKALPNAKLILDDAFYNRNAYRRGE